MDARRLIPIGAVVTVLLVLAGAASHGRPLRPGSGNGPSAVFFDYVATTFFLVALAMMIVVAAALRTHPGRRGDARGPWHVVSTLMMLIASTTVALLIAHSRFEQRLQNGAGNPPARSHQTTKTTAAEQRHARNVRVRWDEVSIVLAAVLGVGVYLFLTRGTPRTPRLLVARRRAAVSRAVGDSIDDLRRDPDLRRAIIAAYARMEDAFARAGVPRTASEAPFEYLERSLVELETSAGSARTLTALFERAKFSHHEPAESMRTEAIDALVAVRDDLTA